MTITQLLNKTTEQKLGKNPVVVLPLNIWQKIESLLEDAEMTRSKNLVKKIAKSRTQKKLYSSQEVKNILKI